MWPAVPAVDLFVALSYRAQAAKTTHKTSLLYKMMTGKMVCKKIEIFMKMQERG